MIRNESGASLIELIMVLVISSLLAAVAAQRLLRDASQSQQRNAARTALRDFEYARNQAMIHGKAVKIKIDVQENRYSVRWAATGIYLNNPVAGGPFVRQFGKDAFLHVRIVDTGLPNGELVFTFTGKPVAASKALTAITTAIQFNGGHRVDVMPHTGQLKLIINSAAE